MAYKITTGLVALILPLVMLHELRRAIADCRHAEAFWVGAMAGIRVRARIRLLPAAETGRTAPIRESYRPNHNFGGADNREMDVGFIEFADDEALHPGEATERELTFLDRPGLSEVLAPGREWRIQEGPRLVAVGTVLEILRESA